MTIACLLACAAAPALAQAQPQQELCGVLQTGAGSSAFVPAPGYSILRTIPPVAPPPGQTDVDAVVCVRESIFIGPVDHRVITDLGVPLFIRSADRIAVLELAEGHLRVRFTRGEPLPAEAEAMRAALDRAEEDIQRTRAHTAP